jgi:hypothetical protein
MSESTSDIIARRCVCRSHTTNLTSDTQTWIFTYHIALYTARKMTSPVRIDWRSRFNTIVELFSEERLFVCRLEARTLLAHHDLPRYYRLKCHFVLAKSEENWYKSKVRHWERFEKTYANIKKAPSTTR